jgi:Tfp pilus assembly protein PilX
MMKRTRQSDQRGMVAIMVTMIMILVITLIVLGFAEVTRRNQREALDSQLGTQAYYAAETGVNDVVNYINTSATPIASNTGCSDGNVAPRPLKGTGANAEVANTCLTVDTSPPVLSVDTISTKDSVLWHVKNSSGNSFSKLNFAWAKDHDNAAHICPAPKGTYPDTTAWKCTHALLRVDIIKASDATTYASDASTLAAHTSTLYLQPYNGGAGTLSVTNIGLPAAYQASCKPDADNICSVRLDLSGAAVSNDYYMRLTSMYLTANKVTLTAIDAITNSSAKFTDGQIVVDSTGRAQDQLKRIRVRIPLLPASNTLPIYAVQGTDTICKELSLNLTTYDKGECGTGSPSIWPN